MKPLVSVIMPVYNQEKFLAETMDSVLSQTYDGFEFLILDDGSTDNSAQIIRKYANMDKRIIPFFESNQGKCVATNFLVSKAVGKFCAFLDADDVMKPHRLKRQVEFHKENFEIDGSSCHCLYIDEKGRNLGKQRYSYLKSIEDCKNVLKENKIVVCAFTGLMTTRKAFLDTGGLRSQFWPCEDADFVNRLIEKEFLIVIIQEVLMSYRIHSSSITSQKQWHMFDMGGYTGYCINKRRAGEPEVSFEVYIQTKKKEGWLRRMKEKMHRHSLIFHKKAGFALYAGSYMNFCWRFATAFFLDPKYIFAILRNRINFLPK